MKLRRLFPWLRKPDAVLIANRQGFDGFKQNLPLSQYEFVVCDTELTGLNKRKDEIVSIGAVKVSGLQIELGNTFHSLVKPVAIDATQATLVHRITPEQLKNAPPVNEVLAEFIQFSEGAILVGHFISLDMHFLNQAARRSFGGTLANPSVDTMSMVKVFKELAGRQNPRLVDHGGSLVLDDLTKEFALPQFQPHDALEDALQTAYLFLFLAKQLEEYGVHTLVDLVHFERSTSEEQLF